MEIIVRVLADATLDGDREGAEELRDTLVRVAELVRWANAEVIVTSEIKED